MYQDFQLYIDGEWVSAKGGATKQVFDPANEDEIGKISDASSEDLDRATTLELIEKLVGGKPVLQGIETFSKPAITFSRALPRSRNTIPRGHGGCLLKLGNSRTS